MEIVLSDIACNTPALERVTVLLRKLHVNCDFKGTLVTGPEERTRFLRVTTKMLQGLEADASAKFAAQRGI